MAESPVPDVRRPARPTSTPPAEPAAQADRRNVAGEAGRRLRGLKHAIRGDSSFFAHAYRGILIVMTAALLGVNHWGWCLLVLAACLVLLAELTHSAVDTLARAIGDPEEPRLKIAREIAAAGVARRRLRLRRRDRHRPDAGSSASCSAGGSERRDRDRCRTLGPRCELPRARRVGRSGRVSRPRRVVSSIRLRYLTLAQSSSSSVWQAAGSRIRKRIGPPCSGPSRPVAELVDDDPLARGPASSGIETWKSSRSACRVR